MPDTIVSLVAIQRQTEEAFLAFFHAALDACERDLAFIAGCTLTDRPDLPFCAETSWKMDFSKQLAAIADARVAACELAAARTDPGCIYDKTGLHCKPFF